LNSLKFNVVEKVIDNDKNLVENFLANRGIENPELFLNPQENEDEIETNPFDILSMEKSIDILKKSIDNEEHIGVLVDDDADGYTSAAALIRMIKEIRGNLLNIEWFFHENKSHGISGNILDELLKSDCDLIIIPDAASNDFAEQDLIHKAGKKLLILDHHNIDETKEVEKRSKKYKDTYALVNNQLKNNDKKINTELTGAGVVYKFSQAYDNKYETNTAEKILDLVATGQIADASDISQYEIRLFIDKGLKNIQSPILKLQFDDKIKNGDLIAPINLSFSIIPIINAVSRIGDKEDKDLVLKSLLGYWDEDERILVTRRRKNKITGKMQPTELEWSHYELAMESLKKIKAKQDKIVNKTKETMDEYLKVGNIAVVAVPEELIEFRSTTGLIANKFISEHMMPALVLVEQEGNDLLSGSARGYESTLEDFREWCLSTGLFELAQGHGNAFGVIIHKDNIEKLLKIADETLLEQDKTYDVDELLHNKSNLNEVQKFNELQHIYGGKVNPPIFGYKDLVITRNSVGQRGSVLTFYHEGLEFIAFKQQQGLLDDFLLEAGFSQYFKIDLVGEPTKNEWTGRVKHQIILQDFTMEILNEAPVKIKDDENWLDENGNLSF